MTTWIFHESSHIPGVPGGPFAHCTVTVHDDGTLEERPLAQYPHLPPVSDAPTADDTASEQPIEAATPETIEEEV